MKETLTTEDWTNKKEAIFLIFKGCSANITEQVLKQCLEDIKYNSMIM